MKPPVLARQARRELHAAASRYERARTGLGEEFLADVRQLVAAVAAEPQAFPRWRDDRPYRKAVMPRRFPFIVFFEEREEEIRVWAIAHARRRPGYWLRRTERTP